MTVAPGERAFCTKSYATRRELNFSQIADEALRALLR
jgi:hypothetical protein